jgi:hypothetical protein
VSTNGFNPNNGRPCARNARLDVAKILQFSDPPADTDHRRHIYRSAARGRVESNLAA